MTQIENHIGKRIVLTTKNEICYAGCLRKIVKIENQFGILVVIDEKSNFSVWCPYDFIKDILVIPIPLDNEYLND
jgi:hypothetical protein